MCENLSLERFKQTLSKHNEDHIKAKGLLASEFSTTADNLLEKMEIAAECSIWTDTLDAIWHIYPCKTCKENDPEYPIHVMLVNTRCQRDADKLSENIMLKNKVRDLKREIRNLNEEFEDKVLVEKDVLKVVIDNCLERNHDIPVRSLPDEVLYLSNLVDHSTESGTEGIELKAVS